MRRLSLLAVLTALAVPAAAHADTATPISLGEGDSPGVAVTADGTAWIAFNGPEFDEPESLHICELPRGASACAFATTINGAVAYGLGRPYVNVADDGTISVVQSREGTATNFDPATYVFNSSDGGVTWTARQAGTIAINRGAFGSDGTFVGATDGTGTVEAVPLATGAVGPGAQLDPDNGYSGAVGVLSDAQRVAVFTDVAGNAQQWISSGDPNALSSWGAPAPIGYAAYPRMASGPNGLFLLDGSTDGGIEVRRFAGTFSPGAAIDEPAADPSQADLFDDAGGRLHAVFPVFEIDGSHLMHAVSDDGVNWSAGTIVTQTDDEETSLSAATAADHIGVAAWASSGEIRAAPIGPDAPVDPPLPPAPVYVPPPLPVPVFHRTVVLRTTGGTVLLKRPGATKFVHVTAPMSIPLGSTIDAVHGHVTLLSALHGAVQRIKLFDGAFRVAQPGSLTEFTLSSCTQRVWADGTGAFRTRGRYTTATVTDGRWLTQNTCSSTLTRVTRGEVTVRDSLARETLTVSAGSSYTAKRRTSRSSD